MKRVGVIGVFLLLIATTTGGILFFRLYQNNAKNLAKVEGRLNEVKKAFEERGRLLDGLKKNSDFTKDLLRKMTGDLDKANLELESYQITKTKMAGLIADRKALDDRVIKVQSLLAARQKTAETNKALAQERLVELQQKLADAKSLGEQLKQANNKIQKLNKDFDVSGAELKLQKQLLMDKLVVIKEFEELGLSPAQVRGLRAENTRLKTTVPVRANQPLPDSDAKEASQRTLKTLPLGLKLPLADKRLTKPLRPSTIPEPTQP